MHSHTGVLHRHYSWVFLFMIGIPFGVGLSPVSWAADGIGNQIEMSNQIVDQLADRVEVLERRVLPGSRFITEAQGVRRFQDCLYLNMLGEYTLAAEGFFSLVTSRALTDSGLHSDAEWYLAEALYKMGNFKTAQQRFLLIADDLKHPFRDDAVRRLLELFATTGQSSEFYDIYHREIVQGRVRPTNLIRYTVAKSFYKQQNFLKAKSYFQSIEPTDDYYTKARYFLGTIMVVQEDLDDALRYFRQVLELPVETEDGRRVRDLALLAVARIHYELGGLQEAIGYYDQVDWDSVYLAEKLYEVIWTFIKQSSFPEALRGVDIFLLGFPDHRYSGRLKLLRGHLQMREGEYDNALTSYQSIVEDYTPVRERLQAEALSDEVLYSVVVEFLENGGGDGWDQMLPSYAQAMIGADVDFSESVGLFDDIVQISKILEETDLLVADLKHLLETSVGLSGFQQLRYDAVLTQGLVNLERLTLLRIEETWLIERSAGESKDAVLSLSKSLDTLHDKIRESVSLAESVQARVVAKGTRVRSLTSEVQRISEMLEAYQDEFALVAEASVNPGAGFGVLRDRERVDNDIRRAKLRLDQLEQELVRLDDTKGPIALGWEQYRELSESVTDLKAAYKSERPAALGQSPLSQLDLSDEKLTNSFERLGQVREASLIREQSEFARINERFALETTAVHDANIAAETLSDDVQRITMGLARNGFDTLEVFFDEAVMNANMGIIDVFWAKKLQTSDRREEIYSQRNDMLQQLEEKFALIRQKLGQ